METIYKQEYRVRDLGTRSVTLFPTRAQVVRDIKDVPLKPGANQITIVGLTPTVDEDSIKVEGVGSAIITDISVELLPNREIFEDIYPDTEDEASDKDAESDDDDDDDEQETESAALKTLRGKLTQLRDDRKRALEVVSSADRRLKILDAYGNMLDRKRGVEIDDGLEKYRQEREKVFRDHMDGGITARNLLSEIEELEKQEKKLLLLEEKARRKTAKAKAKAKQRKLKELLKKERRRKEQLKEKQRLRAERQSFWPRQCYTVRVSLDATSFSPTSSRRSSVSGDFVTVAGEKDASAPAKSADATETGPPTCDISLSYVTSAAFWSPSYDLALNTTSNTGLLYFDARLTNMTSETWTGAKIVLSTSQTTFSGLKDAIPVLVPWRVKLAPKTQHWSDIASSREERAQNQSWSTQQNVNNIQQKPRNQLFGVGPVPKQQQDFLGIESVVSSVEQLKKPVAQEMSEQMVLLSRQRNQVQHAAFQHQQPQQQAAAPTGGFGASLFGQSENYGGGGRRESRAVAAGSFRPTALASAAPGSSRRWLAESEAEPDRDDGATIIPEPVPELDFQESSFEETGLTTTYDLPGLKTLAPGPSASKQRVVRIAFSSVTFSHTVVAKYKPVAFLKVKVRNASKLTLLKGPAGLTLDGSFMGRSTLPRCSPGDHFTMSLGVDPAIKVAYPKPEVKRSTLGLFSKEDNNVCSRCVTLVNTRAGSGSRPVNLVVYDQVPVSEDEKLRVEILQPRGLAAAGAGGVAAGVPARDTAKESDWGKATAALRKEGVVTWDVTLNAGKGVKLSLEYEIACPSNEHVTEC